MALPTVPLFQLGKHLTLVRLTPQAVAANGDLSDTTTVVTVTAYINDLDCEFDLEGEEINAMNSTRRNMVTTSTGSKLNLSILKVNDGTNPNAVRYQVTGNGAKEYWKIEYTEGTATGSINVVSGLYRFASYKDGFQGRGKQIAAMSFDEIDPGQAQVTYTNS